MVLARDYDAQYIFGLLRSPGKLPFGRLSRTRVVGGDVAQVL